MSPTSESSSVRRLDAPDYEATFDGHTLIVKPRPKWLTTVGLIVIAVAILAVTLYVLASGRVAPSSSWAGFGIVLGTGGLAAVRLHRARNEFFALAVETGGQSLSFYYLSREERHLPPDLLEADGGTLGEVEVDISEAPGARTVDGIWTDVRIYVYAADPDRPRRFMYAVSTVDRRADALREFIEEALSDLAKRGG